jgi:phosphatidylglycerol:prolipoprotein diacylglycerol transferase
LLFRVGPTLWVKFGAFAALGTFAATSICTLSLAPSRGHGIASALVFGATAATLVSAWLGARLYRIGKLVEEPLQELRRVGFVSWGGYLGLIACVLAAAHVANLPLLDVIDLALPASLLASAIGRLGCLSYGCCGGRPSAHGIHWRRPESRIVRELGEAGSVPRVPAQLIQSVHAFATFALVAVVAGRSSPGTPTLLVMIVYCLGRFAIEFSREEQRFTTLELTRGQIAALVVFALSTVGLFFLPAEGIAASFHRSSSSPWTLWAPLASGALAFLVCGVHVHRVGRW